MEISGNRFRGDRLARLREIEAGHFWFRARRALVQRLLAHHLPAGGCGLLLDVGCGTASSMELLARHAARPVGLDGRVEGMAARRGAWPFVQADVTALPFAPRSFDAVTLLDVAEHVDDAALLAEVSRVLRPGGLVLLSVPALPSLWSFRDVDAGHLRRYTRRSLRAALEAAPLRVRETRYFQCLLLPLAFASRLLGRRGPAVRDLEDAPGPLLDALLSAALSLEVRLGALVRWPAGSSLLAVAEKAA